MHQPPTGLPALAGRRQKVARLNMPLLPLLLVLLPCLLPLPRSEARVPCPAECTKFGTCYEELGRCDCPWNYTGVDCTTHTQSGFCVQAWNVNSCTDSDPTLCVNACLGRGSCKGGFCHCHPGFFGTDCSLSYAKNADSSSSALPDGSSSSSSHISIFEGMGYRQNKNGPRVYVYEIPPEYHVKLNLHHVDRPPLHLAIYERLLSGGFRTTDGDNADFYFVPITSRALKKDNLLLPLLHYIREAWPYWNRTGGARHIIPMEGDVGTCELPLVVRRLTNKTTWLQFWGLYDFHPAWDQIFHNRIPCHVPGRDIVVPFMAMSSHDRHVVNTPLHRGNKRPTRNATFFFSGGVCGSGRYNDLPPNCTHYKQQRYSGGVRQKIWEEFHGRPGWRVMTRTDDMGRDYSSSVFCLAAPGGGWGKRGIVAAMYGCIPVSATDMLYEAFEPEMDWGRFSIRVAQKDIPKLGDMLDDMIAKEPKRVAEMQSRLSCATQHFHWSSNIGGILEETGEFDAFASIMAILRMRKKHPDADPVKYYDLDPEFRDFVDCKPVNPSKKHDPLCTMYTGPGMELHGFMDACPEARFYMRRKIGPPGGAVCHLSQDLASCPIFD